jgi:dipeptidyl aminopeptidase/acylaminoacyl peptidase
VRTRAADRRATELRRIPLDGAEARRIALGPELTRLLSAGRGTPAPSILNVSWSPDGSRLAFGLNASQRETWVIENPLAGAANASARK